MAELIFSLCLPYFGLSSLVLVTGTTWPLWPKCKKMPIIIIIVFVIFCSISFSLCRDVSIVPFENPLKEHFCEHLPGLSQQVIVLPHYCVMSPTYENYHDQHMTFPCRDSDVWVASFPKAGQKIYLIGPILSSHHGGRTPSTLNYLTLSYLTLSYLTISNLTLSYLTLSYLTQSYLNLSYLTLNYLTLSYLTLCYLTLSYLALIYLTLSYLTLSYTHVQIIHTPMNNTQEHVHFHE